MATYVFSLRDDTVPDSATVLKWIPDILPVMHAGECICEARLKEEEYICDLPADISARLGDGKLEGMFVYEPPVTVRDEDIEGRGLLQKPKKHSCLLLAPAQEP